MNIPEALDSYECDNCGAWVHLPEVLPDEAPPTNCPYCAHETNKPTLTWRTDNSFKIIEIDP